jgi:predicted TIM-barrel fold metal-dependent hydrolase
MIKVSPHLLLALGVALLPLPAQSPVAAPSFERIDAHAHVAPPPPAFLQMLDRAKVRLLNVTLVDPLVPGFDKPEPQSTWAAAIAQQSGGRIAWAAPMDPAGFESKAWSAAEIKRLAADIDRGAVAVKLYKSLGLHLKSASGQYVLPDNLAFSPVFDAIAAKGATLLTHLAEPRSSWQPLDPADPHYNYYKANPDWHMFQHPERPRWEDIIAARDKVLAAHPSLRVIGCHLGSLEHDVDEVAKRLDKYPNFAVDTAARMPNLRQQPRDKVRAFLIKYQDRVLWGTDLMELKWDNPAATVANWQSAYAKDWQFFAGDLALPEPVLRKIFRENALRWIPGLTANIAASQPSKPLPTAEQVTTRYLQAMGGEAALRKINSLAAAGSIFVATYGAYGEYQEFAKAPRSLRRTFRFPRYAAMERAFNGQRAWEEGPDYGLETLSGPRLSEVRRQAEFHLALNLHTVYPKLVVEGRGRIDDIGAIILEAYTPAGERDQLWFDEATGLLLAVDSTETFANGVTQRVRYQYENYQPVNGIPVAHQIRYESPRLIWVVQRRVALNVPLEDSVFDLPYVKE